MISVVIPVYKVELYVEKCIESVISQTFCDWEMILVDDGSPDHCGEICDRFAAKDQRIRVIHQKNAGLSAARNVAMEAVRGDYVTFIDSDDFVDQDHLSSLYEALKESGSDISIAGCLELDEDGALLWGQAAAQTECSVITGAQACERLLSANETLMISAWGKLYARSLFPLIRYPEGRLNEDEYVTYRLLYESGRVSFTGKSTYNYLRHSGGITAKFTTRHLEVVDAFRDAVTFFEEKNDGRMRALAKKHFLRNVRVLYLKSKELPEAERARLLAEWKDAYREYRSCVAGISSFSERVANRFFYMCPSFYSKLCGARYSSCTSEGE